MSHLKRKRTSSPAQGNKRHASSSTSLGSSTQAHPLPTAATAEEEPLASSSALTLDSYSHYPIQPTHATTCLPHHSSLVESDSFHPKPSSFPQRIEITFGPNSNEIRPFGFKVLYEPLTSGVIVDIIAIHGLNGHREETWTDPGLDGQQRLWLRDLLPISIPSARVITYGYDADTDGPSHQTLSGHAQDFVVRLTHYRRETSAVKRPVIFVVHGTGGIIIQLALLEASRATPRHLPDQEDVRFSTFGIIFLGTPHQGFSLPTSNATNSAQAALHNHLRPNSEYLQDLVNMFTPIREYFEIKFLYETRAEAGQGQLMVSKHSATLAGAVNIETLGLNRDHSALAKFTSELDGDYQALMSMMVHMAQKAPEAIQAHWAARALDVDSAPVNNHSQQAMSAPSHDDNTCLFQEGQPPAPHLFIGREMELRAMRDVLLKDSSSRLAILGPGGIGKTTVAQRLMNDEEVLKTFPNPLFVSCENITATANILHAIADVLHITTDERGQALQTSVLRLLRIRPRSLLCLDNFEDAWDLPSTRRAAENLLNVLNGVRSIGIIITMRGTEKPHDIAWTHPQPLPLEPLGDESALALFTAISHCSHEGVSELLKDVDNVPLAIKLLGRLVEEEGLAYVLREWKRDGLKVVDHGDASDTRTTSVTASINLSLNSPRIASIPYIYEILGILSILPDGLSESMVEVLEARLPAGIDLRRILRALKRIALCYLDPNGRYRLLAPIRQHVKTSLSLHPRFFNGVRKTFLKYVICTHTEDHDAIAPEMMNLRSFIAQESPPWDELHVLACLSYLWWENRILGIQDMPLALTALSHAHTPILQVKCRVRISELLRSTCQYDEAREYLIPALCTNTDDPYWDGHTRLEMGDIEMLLDKYMDAETSFRKAADIFKEAARPDWEGSALERLGALLRDQGRTSEAEEHLIRSLELAWNAGDIDEEGNTLRELGNIYQLTDRMTEAEDALRQAIDCHQRSHSVFGEALGFLALGKLQYAGGDLEESEKSLVTSRELSVGIHDSLGEAAALRWLGLLYAKMEVQLDLAEKHFKDSLVMQEQIGSQDGQAYLFEDLGELYSQHGQSSKAIPCWVISIAFHLLRLHKSTWKQVIPICVRIQEAVEEGPSLESVNQEA